VTEPGVDLAVLIERVAQLEKRMDGRFDSLVREMHATFAGAEKAIVKAEAATEKRFEGVNEFRAQLSDQAARFVTRDELAALEDKMVGLLERNREDIEQLAKRLS
jgi:hypothetical protein